MEKSTLPLDESLMQNPKIFLRKESLSNRNMVFERQKSIGRRYTNTDWKENLNQYMYNNMKHGEGLDIELMAKRYTRSGEKIENNFESMIYENDPNESELFEKPKMSWIGLESSPRLFKIMDDKSVVRSEKCRQIYLPKYKKSKRSRPLIYELERQEEPQKNTTKQPTMRRKTKKVLHEKVNNNEIYEIFRNLKHSQIVDFGPKNSGDKHSVQNKPVTSISKVGSADHFFGLDNWHMFHGRNLRKENFEYSKVYPGVQMLMINTTKDIMGISYSLNRNSMLNFRLYQNDQPEMIEDFAFNSLSLSEQDACKFALKHINQDCIRVFDSKFEKYIYKCPLNQNSESIKKSQFVISESNYMEVYMKSKTNWINFDRKKLKAQSLMKRGSLELNGQYHLPSNDNEETPSDLYMYNGLPEQVGREVISEMGVTQYLEMDGSYIYHLDNLLQFQVNDQRLRKCVLSGKLRVKKSPTIGTKLFYNKKYFFFKIYAAF